MNKVQSGRSDDVRREVLEVMGCRHTYYKGEGGELGGRQHERCGRHDTVSLHMRGDIWNWNRNRSVKSHTNEVNYRAKRYEIGDRFLINRV